MPGSPQDLRVFVSSTSKDLHEYRAVARNVILDVKWLPQMMEHIGTRPEATVEAMRAEINGCNLVLLIVGFRRGWVPEADKGGNGVDSITALELAFARENKIPVLAMMASENWPGNMWEDDQEARAWVKRFRDGLNQSVVFFEPEPVSAQESDRLPSFRARVREALLAHQARLLAERSESSEPDSLGQDYFAAAQDGLAEGLDVPFLGTGVYGDGPLSSAELARALSWETPRDKLLSLATAAEYRERLLGSRDLFLDQFKQVIEKRIPRAEPLPIYELMVQLARLPLIVSTVYDQILEGRFKEVGIPYVVVAHILRSAEGEHDGKILVLRTGSPPEIVLADKVEVGPDEHVIYKPLGSPFLHEHLDPELEIDTVVVTETDHLTFLGRLENQHTQIPTAVTRLLRRRPLLFIGYGLDLWQYRLVMQVFQAIGRRGKSPMLAVRTPDSPIEEVTWKRLGAGLIQMETLEFANRVMAGQRGQ